MSVSILSRNRGVCLRCNYDGCLASVTTAQVQAKLIRAYAPTVGWIRGLDPGSGSGKLGTGRPANRRWDICPEHAVIERERAAERKLASDERRAERSRPPTPEVLAERKLKRQTKANAAAKARRLRRKAAAAKHAQVAA